MGSLKGLCLTTSSTCGLAAARDCAWLRRKVRVLWLEGQESQYSTTSLRMWGRKAEWPLAGELPSLCLRGSIAGFPRDELLFYDTVIQKRRETNRPGGRGCHLARPPAHRLGWPPRPRFQHKFTQIFASTVCFIL